MSVEQEAGGAELHALLERFAAIGATPEGGVCRLTGSAEDGAARRLFAELAREKGAELLTDAVGNQFARFRLVDDAAEAASTGSHLDSQPTGGRFDGVYGVLAGLLAAEALARSAAEGALPAVRDVVAVNWTNEEGARFQPSLTGSSAFVGKLTAEQALACRDSAGVTMGEALAAIGALGSETPDFRIAAHVELHVEQGDRLTAAGRRIGVVRGAWATRKLTLGFLGEPSHTGPTPMPMRRDALRGAAAAITALYQVIEARGAGAHGSASNIRTGPDSPNVVPATATLMVELRHPEMDEVEAMAEQFLGAARAACAPLGVAVEIRSDERRPALMMDAALAETVRAAAAACGEQALDLMTVAGHDAMNLQRLAPTALVFVPSEAGGISHNPREFTRPEDIALGLAVLTETLRRLVV